MIIYVLAVILLAPIAISHASECTNATHLRSGNEIYCRTKGRKIEGTPILLGDHRSFDCHRLLQPIFENRTSCQQQSKTEIDVCAAFASDYHYIIPFLVHYLSLGVNRIHVYNNDNALSWYLHPSIVCLVQAGLVQIQPWQGEGQFIPMMTDCLEKKVLGSRGLDAESARKRNDLWMAVFDVDEFLLLHQHTCFNVLMDDYPTAPAIAFNWAFFLPAYKDKNIGKPEAANADTLATFGNIESMPSDHFALINYPAVRHDDPFVVFPHDMTITRTYECSLVKSVTRPGCVGKIYNPHFMELSSSCPQGTSPHDPQHHKISSSPFTPWTDNYYPIAQLNHYWSTSLKDFLRKIHRGIGSDVAPEKGSFRSSDMFIFRKSDQQPNSPTKDTAFHGRYGQFYKKLKMNCPDCFRLDLMLTGSRRQE